MQSYDLKVNYNATGDPQSLYARLPRHNDTTSFLDYIDNFSIDHDGLYFDNTVALYSLQLEV